ncbi:MAG: hypothetical protein HQK83_10275 [Fibrobacteria bacterium]|nr:hypothetical protein [Fibrobacteria bacterium]
MIKMLLPVTKFALVPLMALLLYVSYKEFFFQLSGIYSLGDFTTMLHPSMMMVIVGLSGRAIIDIAFNKLKISNPLAFVDTLEHELTHALFGYLTFSPPISLLATLESGGEVKLKRQNFLVVLAPYFFPLWSIFFACIGFVVKDSLQGGWSLVTSLLFGFFLYRLFLEFRWYQPDLKVYGRIFSSLIVLILLSLVWFYYLHYIRFVDIDWMQKIPTRYFQLFKDLFLLF